MKGIEKAINAVLLVGGKPCDIGKPCIFGCEYHDFCKALYAAYKEAKKVNKNNIGGTDNG